MMNNEMIGLLDRALTLGTRLFTRAMEIALSLHCISLLYITDVVVGSIPPAPTTLKEVVGGPLHH